jgi:hypothetical protein
MASVPGWPVAFRGSQAVAAGLVTPDRLRGPRFRRLLPDVYTPATAEPPGLLLRSLAAYRLVDGRGVLSGYSAAALLGADCARRPDTPAEVTVPGGGLRPHAGLVVHRDRLLGDEVTCVRDIACTTPLRTAFDLARGPDRDEAVVAVDRLANRYRLRPTLLLELCARYRGHRGVARIPDVLALASPYSGSPMETRLRLLIIAAGLPPPCVQWVVQDVPPHGVLARPRLAGAEDRDRVRGRAAHRTGTRVARHRTPDPAGRPRLADLPLHEAGHVRSRAASSRS